MAIASKLIKFAIATSFLLAMTKVFYLGPGAPGGAGGFLNGAPQPVAKAPHIAASNTMLINLFFIAVNVYRYNIGWEGFVLCFVISNRREKSYTITSDVVRLYKISPRTSFEMTGGI